MGEGQRARSWTERGPELRRVKNGVMVLETRGGGQRRFPYYSTRYLQKSSQYSAKRSNRNNQLQITAGASRIAVSTVRHAI